MIAPREQLPPGYEAQVDFGQYKMKDMYGMIVRVYFFAMVLSYSQMRFAYFNREPFSTSTAIKAHDLAFKFYGGRKQTIMYDLDRVFVANENYGDIIYVKKFEEYVKETGYSTTMCRPRDPRTKGRVENLVGYIKYSFLEGRTFTGIDSLNSACLKWLDTKGNMIPNIMTKKAPSEMFREESKYLIPVQHYSKPVEQKILTLSCKNSITYNNNEYGMPRGLVDINERIRVEIGDNMLHFYRADSSEIICKHKQAEGEGNVVTIKENYADKVSIDRLIREFGNDERIDKYIKGITNKRYVLAQCQQLYHISKYYTAKQLLDAIEHSIRVDNHKIVEVASYLVYKYGPTKAKECFSKEKYIMYNKRAKKIKEELNG